MKQDITNLNIFTQALTERNSDDLRIEYGVKNQKRR